MSSRRNPLFSVAGSEPLTGRPSARRIGRLAFAVTLALLLGVLCGCVLYLLLAGA